MRLWLVRHARVMLAGGLCYGASDVPADPDHTQAVAATLATVLPFGMPLWVSARCARTAVASCCALPSPDTHSGTPKGSTVASVAATACV